MLNREQVRKVLVARDKIAQRYKLVDVDFEDVPFRTFLEDVLKEVGLDKTVEK